MYCVNCGKENKDTDTYCSGCGCLLHDTSLQNKEVKSNPFLAIMVVSNIMGIVSAMMPILHVYDHYDYEYINIGLWRYLVDFENLFNISYYQKVFRKIVENGISRYFKEVLCTVFGTTFLAMGIFIYIFSVICALYFIYKILRGIRGKCLANLSSRTMISGITFFLCILIYSFIPFPSFLNDGEKPNISVIGFVILIVFLLNVIYIEKEYVKKESIDDNAKKDDHERVKKTWGLNTLAQLLVLTTLLGIGTTTFLVFSLKDGKPYSSMYGWAIDGEWISSGDGSGHYDNLSVFIDKDYVRVEVDGTQCLMTTVERRDGGVGVNYFFWYRDYSFYLYISPDEIYVEEYYAEGESKPFQYHDTLKRVLQ